MQRHSLLSKPKCAGSALVITLAFMVLLTALLVLFFSQALSYRLQSNTNLSDFKSATLGQSALEIVVGDLIQEMTNGASSTAIYANGSNIVYSVINNLNVVPQRNLANISHNVDYTPNLIRISLRNDPMAAPGVASRASAASSTTPAATGQFVSLARWNKHYLLPRGTSSSGVSLPGTTNIDTTPTPYFQTPPDWVFVTSKGPTIITAPSTSVIGRYAYAMYDEGGLLDANVAGVPSNMVTNSAYPATGANPTLGVWGSGPKGSEAFADLTMTNTLGTPILTQPQIDQLVGWRNNATIQPSGTFTNSVGNLLTASGYGITTSGALNYHDYSVLNTNGFMVTSGASYSDPNSGKIDTDQVFPNRQALIAFFLAAGLPQDSLQYLATFTRDTEQPSYNPPVGRPLVQNTGNANGAGNVAPFGIGNDMWGLDRVNSAPTTNAYTDINPPFLNVRVATAFTRTLGDGTFAPVGDPLVKERFPLSRLTNFPTGQVAPAGSTTNPNSQAGRIFNYFGLTYQPESGSTPGYWIYDHDPANATGIDKLSTVATLGREPDFFELLRAAINVGSVGKGAAYNINSSTTYYTASGSASWLEQAKDVQSNLQILQIGANIIDQSKADDYPTRIEFSGLPSYLVKGVEDLPYLYRIYNWIMCTGGGSTGAILMQPQLWNPHSTGSSGLVPKTMIPTNFRVRAAIDPADTSNTSPLSLQVYYYQVSPATIPIDTDLTTSIKFNSGNTLPAPLTFNAGAANGYWDFREPTLLAQVGKPVGSNLATTDPTFADYPPLAVDPTRQMTGFTVVSGFAWTNPAPANYVYKADTEQVGNNSSLRFYVEYQDPAGNWVDYDDKPLQPYDGVGMSSQVPQTSGGANVQTSKDIQLITTSSNPIFGDGMTDPRTSRWGFDAGEYLNYVPPVTTGPSADTTSDPVVWGSERPTGAVSYGYHIGGKQDKGFVGTANNYQDAGRGFQDGYWAENSVRATDQTDTPDSGLRYNLDPDGVPRRAMGGYVSDPNDNGGTSYTHTTPEGTVGLPLVQDNYSSRPTMLHRPFRSVAELGYVFRDSPWGNINFSFPESGDSPLLDVFCVNDSSSTYGLVAGRVDLNTHQAPVLAALLSGSLTDKDNSTTPILSHPMANDIAIQLITRTTNPNSTTSYGPLMSRADLVGTWSGPSIPTGASGSSTALSAAATADTINPDNFYTGFSHDIGFANLLTGATTSITGTTIALIPRQREAAMRALVDSGTTRTWNVLIDLVAQSGRFAPNATSLNNFVVEGEKHYWLHVAIDRFTGKVIDSQLEVVKE